MVCSFAVDRNHRSGLLQPLTDLRIFQVRNQPPRRAVLGDTLHLGVHKTHPAPLHNQQAKRTVSWDMAHLGIHRFQYLLAVLIKKFMNQSQISSVPLELIKMEMQIRQNQKFLKVPRQRDLLMKPTFGLINILLQHRYINKDEYSPTLYYTGE